MIWFLPLPFVCAKGRGTLAAAAAAAAAADDDDDDDDAAGFLSPEALCDRYHCGFD